MMPDIPLALAPVMAFALDLLKALVFLVLGWIAASRISAFVRNRAEKARRLDKTLGVFIANAVKYALLIAVGIAVLQTFGFQVTSLVAMLGAATLAIGLALQGTLSHLAAGLMILVFRPYKLGDFIQVGGNAGTVSDMNLFLTELTSLDGAKIYLPNGEAWGKTITNHSVSAFRRCDIVFAIDYDDDIDTAIGIIHDVVAADERFLQEPAAPWVQLVKLNDSSLDIELRAWSRAADVWDAKFATLKSVKLAFDRAGISIPYPHQTVVTKDAA